MKIFSLIRSFLELLFETLDWIARAFYIFLYCVAFIILIIGFWGFGKVVYNAYAKSKLMSVLPEIFLLLFLLTLFIFMVMGIKKLISRWLIEKSKTNKQDKQSKEKDDNRCGLPDNPNHSGYCISCKKQTYKSVTLYKAVLAKKMSCEISAMDSKYVETFHFEKNPQEIFIFLCAGCLKTIRFTKVKKRILLFAVFFIIIMLIMFLNEKDKTLPLWSWFFISGLILARILLVIPGVFSPGLFTINEIENYLITGLLRKNIITVHEKAENYNSIFDLKYKNITEGQTFYFKYNEWQKIASNNYKLMLTYDKGELVSDKV